MPNAWLTGVEAALYPSMYAALNGLEAPGLAPTLAEGIAEKAPEKLTLPIIRERVDKIILVDEGFLEIAVKTLCEIEKNRCRRRGYRRAGSHVGRA
jgi:threonine dehydratase